MKRFFHPVILVTCLLVACEPRERAGWSPDGRRAAVLTDQGLCFTDSTGNLSAPLSNRDDEAGRFLVDAFDWLSDASGLVLHRVRIVESWSDFSALLPPADAARVGRLAASAPALLESAVVLHGDADRAEQLLGKLAPAEPLALGNALRLAFSQDPESLRTALADAPRALASLDDSEAGYVLHEIAVLRPDSGETAKVLWRGLRGVQSLKVSPNHSALAAALPLADDGLHDLLILQLDGSASRTAATGITKAFDWTPDGGAIVAMSSISGGKGGLVEIERIRVLDEGGRLIEPQENGEELAYAVVAFSPRLAVLPDGDVLFPSHPANLPAAASDLEASPRLYRLPAEGGPAVPIPAEPGALPMDLGYFACSPDGKRIVVVESGTDAVALLDLESGKSEIVSEPHPGWKTRLMPSWRNASEFTFAAVDPDSKRVDWLLWKDGKTTRLSDGWPDKSTNGFLEFK